MPSRELELLYEWRDGAPTEQVFGDATAAAAVIDRIVHHATVLQTKGPSFRLKDAKAKRPRRPRKKVTTT